MPDHRYIDIIPLEKQGWYLTRQTRDEKNRLALQTKPLRSVPEIKLTQPAPETPDKHFAYPPTFRDTDENGKPVCRRCGIRLGAAKTAYCSSCGGQFVEEADE